MRELMLLRHAKAEPLGGSEGASDFARPLAPRGRKDAAKTGRWMRERALLPDRILSSPAARARETTLLVLEALRIDEARVEWEPRVYDATVGTLLAVLEGPLATPGRVLLVGHNPGMEDLLRWLVGGKWEPPPKGKPFPTSALARLRVPAPEGGWTPGGADLLGLVRPKAI